MSLYILAMVSFFDHNNDFCFKTYEIHAPTKHFWVV